MGEQLHSSVQALEFCGSYTEQPQALVVPERSTWGNSCFKEQGKTQRKNDQGPFGRRKNKRMTDQPASAFPAASKQKNHEQQARVLGTGSFMENACALCKVLPPCPIPMTTVPP